MTQSLVFATAYSIPSSLINIPVAKDHEKGDLSYGTYLGFSDKDANEFDAKFTYAPYDNLILGLTMTKPTVYVGNIHWQFYNTPKFGAAAGLLNVGGGEAVDTWEDISSTDNVQFSQYITTRFRVFDVVNIHVGYGTKRFQEGNPGVTRNGIPDGLFYGIEIPIYKTKFIFEFDGRDMNAGFNVPISKHGEFNFSMTELLLNSDTNANYGNSPTRFVTFGFTFNKNIFEKEEEQSFIDIETRLKKLDMMMKELYGLRNNLRQEIDGYKQEKLNLEEEVGRLRFAMKEDSRYVLEHDKIKKEDLRRHYLGINQELGEKVITLYYESFEFYYKKEFYKAIESLQKALVIDPYLPQLYVRLGSIYYELKLHTEALSMWERAYELDPHSPDLQELMEKVKR
jgi:hypothetical protein